MEAQIRIREGKFHQVKRMVEAIDNEVVYLKRVMIGALGMPNTLAKGEVKTLTDEEVAMLFAMPDDL